MISISSYLDFDKSEPNGLEDNNSYLSVTCCGHDILNNFSFTQFRKNGRKDFYFLYIKKGSVSLVDDNKQIVLSKDTIIYYPPNKPQKYLFTNDCTETYWIHFSGYAAFNLLSHLSINKPFFELEENIKYINIFENIILELQTKKNNFKLRCSYLLIELLSNFALYKKTIFTENNKFGLISDDIQKVIKYMHENYAKSLSIEVLANICHLSPYSLLHKFKKEISLSPMIYLRNLRVEQGKKLLLSTNLSISDISYLTGFKNPYYFSRVFKQVTDYSPSFYRKSLQ